MAGLQIAKSFKNRDTKLQVHDYSNIDGIEHIKQEVNDALIASRAAYESTSEGAVEVLNRSYDLDTTSQYELLYHRDQANSMASATCGGQQQNFVMVRSSNGYIIVACRGTVSISDIVQDVKIAKVPVPSTKKGRAQIGFVERAMCLPIDLFLNLLRAGEKLLFTGHSLGGAVTSLVAIRVLETLAAVPGHGKISRDRVKCITFGTAPFANLELADHVNSQYREFFYNLVSKHDVVPRAHNLAPQVFFPAAKWLVDTMSEIWEVQIIKAIIETMTGMPVVKVANRLEEGMQWLWPATRLFKYILDCAAGDEEAVFYGHCGYLVLLDPEARTPKSVIHIDDMESLGNEFGFEGKSVVDIFGEHGLENYYGCLLKTLSTINDPSCELKLPPSEFFAPSQRLPVSVTTSMLSNLSPRSLLVQLKRFILRVTGNDF